MDQDNLQDDSSLFPVEGLPRIRRLHRSSPLKTFLRRWQEGKELPGEFLDVALPILEVPRNKQWVDRTVAAELLGRMPLEGQQRARAVRVLTEVLEDDALPLDFGGRLKNWFLRTALCSFPIALLISLRLIINIEFHEGIFAAWMIGVYGMMGLFIWLAIMLFISVPVMPVSYRIDKNRMNRVRVSAALALERLQAVDSVDTLIHWAVRDKSQKVRTAALSALRRVLPLLTVDYYGRLKVETIPLLCRLLGSSSVIEDGTILEALGKVGGGQAVEPVERYIAMYGDPTNLTRDKQLNPRIAISADQISAVGRGEVEAEPENLAQASRILPILKERQRIERDAASLVRASTSPKDPETILMRPAQDSGQTQEQILVRAIGTEDR